MSENKLKAGAGSGVIRFPAEMFPTDGFQGIHDDPHVRVLVLDCGVRVAIAACELVNVPDEGIDLARRIIAKKTGTKYENIWVHATHAITTPHEPRDPDQPGPPPPPGKTPDPDGAKKKECFTAALTAAVTKAAEEAAASFQAAVLNIGTGKCDVNVNRDVETPHGWWVGHAPDGPSNKTATVLRVDALDGKPIGMLVSYGLKPCAIDNSEMDKGTRLVSSDVPGLACTLLEEKFGAPCLFVMSAAGDQVPKEQAWYEEARADGTVGIVDHGVEKGLEIVSRLGKQMAEELSVVVESAAAAPADDIRRGKTAITWPTKGRTRMQPTRCAEFTAEGEAEVGADLITIGDLALVAVKPEVNTQTETELKNASPYAHTLLLSMVNGGMKYMPDQSSYDRGTWESQSARFMPGVAEAWLSKTCAVLDELKKGVPMPVVTAVGEARPDGERITKAIIEFADSVPDVNAIEVRGRTITGRQVNGRTVTLTLSEDDEAGKVFPEPPKRPRKPGEGPQGPAPAKGGPNDIPPPKPQNRPRLPERKLLPICVTVKVPGLTCEIDSTKVSEPVIEDFTQGEYRGIPYNLYVPKNQEPGKKYPIVMFIPDAGVNGADAKIALAQGIGATVWAQPAEQEKRPCYILAVQIPKTIHLTNDEYVCAPELEDIKALLDKVIAENNIDANRVYTTGQSQGCMASCELNCRYPDFFAASLLVSGQWDPEKVGKLTNNKFFIGLSEGGLREFPGMNAITANLEKNGGTVNRVWLNFRDGWEVNDGKVRAAEGDSNVVYAIFEAATIFPDDGVEREQIAHHARGWELTYQLESAREWIFRQHK